LGIWLQKNNKKFIQCLSIGAWLYIILKILSCYIFKLKGIAKKQQFKNNTDITKR